MFILCQHQIDRSNLPIIKSTLDKFVKNTEKLYGPDTIRINIHQLLHLIDRDVESWGLLWTHNAFIYESMNGFFIKLIHGTKILPKAAIYALSCIQNFGLNNVNIKFKDNKVTEFYQKLQKETKRYLSNDDTKLKIEIV
jgi:hypothetical protein